MAKAPRKQSRYDTDPAIKDLPQVRAGDDEGTFAEQSEAPVLKKGTFTDPVTGITITHN